MKVIDLLNKIANGEEVKFKTKTDDCIYELTKGAYLYNITNKEETRWFIDERWLNDEVEIIEDKKIENLYYMGEDKTDKLIMIRDKINEIIDKLNEEK